MLDYTAILHYLSKKKYSSFQMLIQEHIFSLCNVNRGGTPSTSVWGYTVRWDILDPTG